MDQANSSVVFTNYTYPVSLLMEYVITNANFKCSLNSVADPVMMTNGKVLGVLAYELYFIIYQ